jgi:hypothetical protein
MGWNKLQRWSSSQGRDQGKFKTWGTKKNKSTRKNLGRRMIASGLLRSFDLYLLETQTMVLGLCLGPCIKILMKKGLHYRIIKH